MKITSVALTIVGLFAFANAQASSVCETFITKTETLTETTTVSVTANNGIVATLAQGDVSGTFTVTSTTTRTTYLTTTETPGSNLVTAIASNKGPHKVPAYPYATTTVVEVATTFVATSTVTETRTSGENELTTTFVTTSMVTSTLLSTVAVPVHNASIPASSGFRTAPAGTGTGVPGSRASLSAPSGSSVASPNNSTLKAYAMKRAHARALGM